MDTIWHRWFAWRPVLVTIGQRPVRRPVAWLEPVWRRKVNGRWEYEADPVLEEEEEFW